MTMIKKSSKKDWSLEKVYAVEAAENRLDVLLESLHANHPRVIDAKEYIKQLEAM